MTDTVPFYLQREPELLDSADLALSEWWYQVLPTDDVGIRFAVDSVTATVEGGTDGALLALSGGIYSLFFILFILALALLGGVIVSGGGWVFGSVRRLLTPKRARRSMYKHEVTVASVWAVVALLLQSLLVTSMVVYRGFDLLDLDLQLWGSSFLVFAATFIGILLFILIKGGVYHVTHRVFPEWGFGEWRNKFYTLMGMSGVMIFIPALFFVFTPEWTFWALGTIVILLLFSSLLVFINLLSVFVKNKIGLLNYFLYLCAFEIMPLILLYKGLSMNL